MKKKLVTGLLMCAMVGTMLTACGDNKEVTKVDESTAVITETTEAVEEPTEEVTDPINAPLESETETVEAETEEVAAEDFLSKNGLVITPQGSMTMLLTPSNTSDDVEEMDAVVSVVTTESDEEGYSDTTATFEVTMNSSLWYFCTAFDRYTGTCLASGATEFETNENATHHSDVCVIDVDGTQYDCAYSESQEVNGALMKVTMSVHHPSDYEGVAFVFGAYGAAQDTVLNDVDFNTVFTLDQYPALLEGQYFFTATDK